MLAHQRHGAVVVLIMDNTERREKVRDRNLDTREHLVPDQGLDPPSLEDRTVISYPREIPLPEKFPHPAKMTEKPHREKLELSRDPFTITEEFFYPYLCSEGKLVQWGVIRVLDNMPTPEG